MQYLNRLGGCQKLFVDLVVDFAGERKEGWAAINREAERLAFAEFDSADHACHFSYFRLMERRRNMKSGSIRKFAYIPSPKFPSLAH
jgi:hypothetical protein